MPRSKLLLVALVLFLGATGIRAQQGTLTGAGSFSCGAYLASRSNTVESDLLSDMVGQWVQGFLSGMNVQAQLRGDKTLRVIPDYASLIAYMDKYCRDNPLHRVYQGTLSLYKEIQ